MTNDDHSACCGFDLVNLLGEDGEPSVPQTRGGVFKLESKELRADTQHDLGGVSQIEIAFFTRIDRDHTVGRPQFYTAGLTGEHDAFRRAQRDHNFLDFPKHRRAFREKTPDRGEARNEMGPLMMLFVAVRSVKKLRRALADGVRIRVR